MATSNLPCAGCMRGGAQRKSTRHPSPVRCAPARGFTMVEMLIVIGIIVLLFTMVSSLVGNARDAAKRAMCANNVRQLCLASVLFASDNDGRLPMPLYGERGAPNNVGWLYTAPFPKGGSPPLDYMKTGSIWKYVNSMDAYRCPAHPGPYADNHLVNGFNTNTEWITSYLMNGCIDRLGSMWPIQRLAAFQPDAIMIWEAQEHSAPFNDGSSRPEESDTRRHITGSTYGRFDGAAEYIRTPDFITMRNTPRPNRLWCYPSSNGQ